MRVGIVIDGAYFEKVCAMLKSPLIDFKKLIRVLAEDDEVVGTYFHHCLPPSRPEYEEPLRKKEKFFYALSQLGVIVKLGKLTQRRNIEGELFLQQKQVDTAIAVDITVLGVKSLVDRIVLITGDSDLVPAVKLVSKLGIGVTLWSAVTDSTTADSELLDWCSRIREITKELLESIRLY